MSYLNLNYRPIVIVDSMKAYKLEKYFLSKFDANIKSHQFENEVKINTSMLSPDIIFSEIIAILFLKE